jgi:thiol-disulfide isomerase/thioredoxin
LSGYLLKLKMLPFFSSMAPWCPACRSFQATWQSLAEWSKDLEINVGIVDITENPGLFLQN